MRAFKHIQPSPFKPLNGGSGSQLIQRNHSPRRYFSGEVPGTSWECLGNVLGNAGFTPVAGATVHMEKQEKRMINSAIRFVTLAMFLAALVAAPPVIPAFAAGGGGGGEDPIY